MNHIIPDRASSSQSQNPHQTLLYVPDGPSRLEVVQQCHDTPMAGHFGIHETFELISRRYWWPRLRHFVMDYVRSCDTCCRFIGQSFPQIKHMALNI